MNRRDPETDHPALNFLHYPTLHSRMNVVSKRELTGGASDAPPKGAVPTGEYFSSGRVNLCANLNTHTEARAAAIRDEEVE